MKKRKEIREWINTIVAILALLTLIVGTIIGLMQLNEININLKEIKADKLSVNEIEFTYPNGTVSMVKAYHNGTAFIIGG